MKITKIHPIVRDILQENEDARNNYIVLYKEVFKKFGFNTDLNEMKFDCNIFESISRAARKCVENNPSLASKKRVLRNRKKKEEEIKQWNKNSL